MRFQFVDRISHVGTDEIAGECVFAADEPFQYPAAPGPPMVASGIVMESVGQLVSWLCLERNDFSQRPIFVFADRLEHVAPVRPGTRVELRAHVNSMENGVVCFSGGAYVDGAVVEAVTDSYAYFVPLESLEDPAETRRRFMALRNGGVRPPPGGAPFRFERLIDRVVDCKPREEVMVAKTMAEDEPFFPEHFPRNPITPAVILSETVVAAAARLLDEPAAGDLRTRLKAVRHIKVRKCVKPGDYFVGVVRALRDESAQGVLAVSAELLMGGKWVMRGQYEFNCA